MVSNLAAWREYRRIKDELDRPGRIFCPIETCENYHYAFQTNPERYYRRGASEQGRQRLSCKICGKSITVSDHSRRESRTNTYKDLGILRLLINQSHIQAIARINDITPQGVYHAIDRIYKQCRMFTAHRERQLENAIKGKKLNVAADQQLCTVNWSNRKDRRLTIIPATTSVDNRSRYCFAMNLSFDNRVKQKEIEQLATECDDQEKPKWAREYAQYWLQIDYDEARLAAVRRSSAKHQRHPGQEADEPFAGEDMTSDQKLPDNGVQVHNQYTLIGHFLYLKDLFKEAKFIQFSLDRDVGIKRALISAFGDRMLKGVTVGFFVKIKKGLGNDIRRHLVSEATQLLYDLAGSNAPLEPEAAYKIKAAHLETLMADDLTMWLDSPFHEITQPFKSSQLIEVPKPPSRKKLAWLHLFSSLLAVDSLFNATRRSVSYLERPISKETNEGRAWTGKAPYNSGMIEKLLVIHRTYYNFIKRGNDKKTPAMRIGIANAPLKVEDVMYFNPFGR